MRLDQLKGEGKGKGAKGKDEQKDLPKSYNECTDNANGAFGASEILDPRYLWRTKLDVASYSNQSNLHCDASHCKIISRNDSGLRAEIGLFQRPQ
jgi:pyruvate carboxylase